MTDTPQPSGPIVATGITASMLSGAAFTLLIGYIHLRYNLDLTQPNLAEYEGALHTLFEAVFTGVAMVGHLLLRRFLST